MKLYNVINPKIIILISFIFSIFISNYNLNKYDNFFVVDGEQQNHKMIKYDAYRYMSHGAEIKKEVSDGESFFKSGREHFTKYLPPRLANLGGKYLVKCSLPDLKKLSPSLTSFLISAP